ncbi:MAG: hypothetical protein BIFFINMI_02041 [Phycisphaerae bacterium]|nr:hypothetical protein [Phycisphaerae bacterium]
MRRVASWILLAVCTAGLASAAGCLQGPPPAHTNRREMTFPDALPLDDAPTTQAEST